MASEYPSGCRGPTADPTVGGMNAPTRVVLDIVLRSAVLLFLTEGVAELYASSHPEDDGIGTGLTVMLLLVCACAGWGLWDGFHRSPVRLCVTWVVTGAVVWLGSTVYRQLRYGDWSWSELVHDLPGDLIFWSSLVFVPAIVCGIAQSATRRSAT